jgi:predicted permease
MNDLRHGFRVLLKSPGFSVVAIATAAICLGANLTIFAAINSILLRPLPFPQSDRLVTIFNTYPKAGVENDGSSITNYYERRGHIPALASLSIFRYGSEVVGETGSTEQEELMRVSPEFFQTLGVGLAMGRTFTEPETITPVEDRGVAILTDAYWRQRYNSDPNILGQILRVNGVPRKIIGVLPAGFRFLSSRAQFFLPLTSRADLRTASNRHSGGGDTHMIARLKLDATIAQAQAQIDAHNAAVERDDPEAKAMAEAGFRSPVVPLHADYVRSIRPTLLLMQGGVFFLLLIGAVNLVNLLLIRASGRTKEIAIRRSLGASRRHVVQQVLAETVTLTFVGGLLGLVVGAWGVRLLEILGADRLPLGAEIAFDGGLAAIGLVGAVVLGVVVALPIAWFNLRSHLANALHSESRSGTVSRAAQQVRHGFIVAQIALAFVLLAGAGLLGLSLKKVLEVSPGFRADHTLTGQFTLPWGLFDDRVAVLDRLLAAIRQQPGVVAAGMITNLPLSGDNGKTAVTPKGYTGQSLHGHYSYGVEGEYFQALGIPLREGRFLNSADSQRPERVCVVDEDFARRYWPGGGAVGHQVFHGPIVFTGRGGEPSDRNLFTIVGVVGTVKQAGLTEPSGQGAIYLPFRDRDSGNIFVATRTSQRPEAFAETLRKVLRTTEPELAIDDVCSMETRIDDSLIAHRSPALLAGIFAGVALLLAAIGTYGVLSFAVAQRRREIGIRMALGAQRPQIGAQFFSLGLRLLAAGIIFGLIGAWATGRAMQSVLFDAPALPVAALAATTLVITFVSLIACLVPARRAMAVDPMVALRYE